MSPRPSTLDRTRGQNTIEVSSSSLVRTRQLTPASSSLRTRVMPRRLGLFAFAAALIIRLVAGLQIMCDTWPP